MNVSDIAGLFAKVKRIGDDRYQACCPAHDDSSPSLSLRQAGDRVLVHCHAGCTFQQISDAVGLDPREWFNDTEIRPERKPAPSLRRIEREVFVNRTAADRARLREIGDELRRRDAKRIEITQAVHQGKISEAEALHWLEPLYSEYAELEHEFTELLPRVMGCQDLSLMVTGDQKARLELAQALNRLIDAFDERNMS